MLKRDPDDICANCPAWVKNLDHEGKEMLVELRDANGPIIKNGMQQYEKDAVGKFVIQGICRLKMPQLYNLPQGLVTTYPAPKSNWFCDDPAKHAMLDRLKGGQHDRPIGPNPAEPVAARGPARAGAHRGNSQGGPRRLP